MKNIIVFAATFCITLNMAPDNCKKLDSIQGNWCLVDKGELAEVNYGFMEFEADGVAILFSKADTMYTYQYRVDNGKLYLFHEVGTGTGESVILKLSSDSLVLSSLLEKNSVQRYYRCGKSQKKM